MTNGKMSDALGMTEERMDELIKLVKHKVIDEGTWTDVISKVEEKPKCVQVHDLRKKIVEAFGLKEGDEA